MAERGQPRNFKTPDDLWKAFEEYRQWTEKEAENWQQVQYVGKDGIRVSDKFKLPLTIEGFRRYCRQQGYGHVRHYFDNQDGLYGDYIEICHAIRDEIRENQIIGGLIGIFNPSITQRLNGLTEKQETKHEGGIEIKIKRA